MVESAATSGVKVTDESHFDQHSVSLLSAITTNVSGVTVEDRIKLKFLIKVNQLLCSGVSSEDALTEGLKEE
jgi:hypothetical protein